MNRTLILITALISVMAYAEEIKWREQPVHVIDIDCDGIEDSVYMGSVGNDFIIRILASSSKKESKLQFGLAPAVASRCNLWKNAKIYYLWLRCRSPKNAVRRSFRRLTNQESSVPI